MHKVDKRFPLVEIVEQIQDRSLCMQDISFGNFVFASQHFRNITRIMKVFILILYCLKYMINESQI